LSNTGTFIKEKNYAKDLEIAINSDGTFHENMHGMVESARWQCGWVLRMFRTKGTVPMLKATLLKFLTLPHLDYCSQLWCLSRVGEIQALGMVE